MAEKNDSVGIIGEVRIFIIDNNTNRDYISFLREKGYAVERISWANKEEQDKFYSTKADVFIFGYGQNSSHKSGGILAKDSACGCSISGIELAKYVNQWSDGSKYIHIVSSHASEERPPGGELSWNELLDKKIISSYSNRDRESFSSCLPNIEDFLKE